MKMQGGHVKYVPDNSRAKGMGGLLMSQGVAKVARRYAMGIAATVPVAAAAASAGASRQWSIEPGWVLEAYSNLEIKESTATLVSGGHRNPRKAARIIVDTPPGNTSGGLVQSSAVTLEFGSHYNEGTSTDRPALGVLGNAAKAYAARSIGIRGVSTMTRFTPMYIGKG